MIDKTPPGSVAQGAGAIEPLGIASVIAAALLLTISSTNPLQVLGALAVLWAVGGIGLRVLNAGELKPQISASPWAWRLGPGVVLGILILFLIRLITTKSVFVWILLAIAIFEVFGVLRSWFRKRALGERKHHFFSDVSDSVQHVCLVLSVLSLFLSREWQWTFPIALGGLIAASLIGTRFRVVQPVSVFILILFSASTLIAAVWIALELRPKLWWILADDYVYFEALSNSLLEFGPRVNPLAAALAPTQASSYHHGVYLLGGLVDYVIQGEMFQVQTRIIPVLLAMMTFSALTVFVLMAQEQLWRLRNKNSLFLLAVTFVVTVPVSHFAGSNQLGVVAVISTVSIVVAISRTEYLWRHSLLLAALILATALSKIPFAYAPMCIIGSVIVLSRKFQIRKSMPVLITFIAIFEFVRRANPAGGDYSIRWISESAETVEQKFSLVFEVVRIVVIGSSLVPIIILTALQIKDSREEFERRLLGGLLGVLTLGFVARLLLDGRGESISYIWMPALVASGLLHLMALGWLMERSDSRGTFTLLLGCVAGLFLILLVNLYRLVSSSGFVSLVFSFAVVAMLLGQLNPLSKEGRGGSLLQRSPVKFAAGLLMVLSVSMAVADNIPSYMKAYRESLSGETDVERVRWLPTANILEVTNFLREQTPSASLVGLTLCRSTRDDCEGNSTYLFAAYSGRQFLSLGGSFILDWPQDRQVLDDYASSISVGSSSLSTTLKRWQTRGVDYGIIDKQLVSRQDRAFLTMSTSVVEFENNRYLVLKLTD